VIRYAKEYNLPTAQWDHAIFLKSPNLQNEIYVTARSADEHLKPQQSAKMLRALADALDSHGSPK
jgi:hypothetical protein